MALNSEYGSLFFVVLIGLTLIVFGAYDYVNLVNSIENAETVEAKVLESDVVGSNTNFRPVVEFEYNYEGETYISDNIEPARFSNSYRSRSQPENIIEEYSEGETIQAYTDPSNPENAFLKREISSSAYAPIIFGLIILIGVVVRRTDYIHTKNT